MRISDWSSDVCSSDLAGSHLRPFAEQEDPRTRPQDGAQRQGEGRQARRSRHARAQGCQDQGARRQARSEEHTSELQSLMRISYAVFCLKKKKINTYNRDRPTPTTTYHTTYIHTDSQ